MSKSELQARLNRLTREYRAALAEIQRSPNGNGYATQDEMRKRCASLYGGTIASVRRKLGIL